MKCVKPITIKNPAYYSAIREGDFDRARALPKLIEVPCGKCYYCQSKRRSEWTFRLWVETMHSKSCFFVTLTYDNEHYPKDGKLNKRDFQLFIKRLRKHYGKGIRYFGCGEYGPTTRRPHYHILIFNLPLSRNTEKDLTLELRNLWSLGFSSLAPGNINRIGYLTKYILKTDFDSVYKNFMLCSLKPAIGSQLKVNFDEIFENSGRISFKGHRSICPRYYKNLLSREQRDKLSTREPQRKIDERSTMQHYLDYLTDKNLSDRKLQTFSKKSLL